MKVVQEDNGSHDPQSKGQALRMAIYPSHGYARKLIRSLLASAILISQRGPVCQVMSKHMTEVRIQKTPQNILRVAKVERWVMPTWCYMFNSTLTGSARGEVADGNQEQKSLSPWKQQESGHKQNFKKGGFKNQQRSEQRHDRFTLLSKSPKEIWPWKKENLKLHLQ
ncbi:hypothetical protein Tco_0277562 [Tanacetum coccineum]